MKVSQSSRYAIRAVVAIAAHKGPGFADGRRVATAHGLPAQFVSKLLRLLVKAGLLQSLRGPNGGYRLAKTANRISLLEILEAVDGVIGSAVPAAGDQGAGSVDARLQSVFDRAAETVRRHLRGTTVGELMATKGKGPASRS
jgi:Rrf2 family iron-sulfur cluster assembly transcriptional regulator